MDFLLSEQKHFSDDTSSSSPQKMCSYAGSYSLIRKIQMGGQACIYLSQKNQSYYALKVYSKGEAQLRAFRNEVTVLERLDWRGLVPIAQTADHVPFKWEGDEETTAHIIAMPFIERGDLFEWVGKHGCFTEGVTRYFGKKMVATLRYLNSQHVFHRDIKPQNILLDEHFQPLLLDFGLSMDSRQRVHNFVGDVRYASPQVIKHVEYTEKSEVYSLGILLFYLLTGQYPFTHARISDPHYRLLVERKHHTFWEKIEERLKNELSASFKELLIKMISPKATDRPNFDQILQYSWFCEPQPTLEQYQRCFQGQCCISHTATLH